MNYADLAIGGASGGASLGVALFLLNSFGKLLFARIDKREDRLDAGQDKLFTRMQAQIDRLEELLADCKANHADSEKRVACLEMKVAQLSGAIG